MVSIYSALLPCKYWRHFIQALKMVINYLPVTWYLAFVGVSVLLKNATRHYSANSSVLRPTTDASQCI